MNFCLGNNLMVMNTMFFQKKANRTWTRESPDGKTRNMIEYILVNKRWKSSISVCRSFSKPDVASDHQLVITGVKIKLKTRHREATVKNSTQRK